MRRRPFIVAGAIAAALALVLPAGADALTLSTLADGTLRMNAPEGALDEVGVRFGGTPLAGDTPETDTIEIAVYSSAPIVDQAGCTAVSAAIVRCPRPSGFDIDLGAGNDSLAVDLVVRRASTGQWPYAPTIPIGPITVRDGGGNDFLTFKTVSDVTVVNGPGDDNVVADQAPAIRVIAGPGADRFKAENTFFTRLTVDYSAYDRPVSVTQDFVDDDGAAGEHDAVFDAYSVIGGSGNDTLQSYPYSFGGRRVLEGGPGDDVLEGGDGNETIDGGPGADRIAGGYGTDIVTYADRAAPVSLSLDGIGNDGEKEEGDSIAADVEDLRGGKGDDSLSGNAKPNVLDGGPGIDSVSYAASALPVRVTLAPDPGIKDDGAENERDELVGMERAVGSPFNDVLTGYRGAERLDGAGGSDVLDGQGGADELIGGAGSGDRVDYSGRGTPVAVAIDGLAADGEAGEGDLVDTTVEEVVGGSAADVLTGSPAGDSLSGGPGNDRIDGAGGDDQLIGGSGSDVIRGAAGADAIGAVDGARDSIACDGADYAAIDRSDLAKRCAQRVVGVVPAGSTVRALRSRIGTGRADLLRGTNSVDRIWGKRGNDRIFGRAGSDVLRGGTGQDSIFGDGGNDQLFGDEAPDLLFGGSGDDSLAGWTGSDRLDGGPGDDVAEGGSGDDVILGAGGNDRGLGGYGHDTLRGGSGDDDLAGDAAPDVLRGESGNDALSGGSGVDTLNGGDGNDDLIGGSGPDKLVGGAGDDSLYLNDDGVDELVSCGEGDDTVYLDPATTVSGFKDRVMILRLKGECEHQVDQAPDKGGQFDGQVILTSDQGEARAGSELADKLLGGLGPDVLHGGPGNDLLWGDRSPGPASPDVIRGGAGNDTMYGGGADDIVDGGAGDDMVQGDAGADRLFGGTGADLLRPAAGRDFVFGGPGDDTIRAEADKARDVIDCGPGRDIAYVDRIDRVRGCESVRYD